MKSNNKKRLLQLIQILRKETDIDHQLTLKEISQILADEEIDIQNRKTLYDDFKIISEFGYETEYQNGYYLDEAPFSLSEIKIIIDSINSLKNLDDRFLNKLKDKLYSFISYYDEDLLKNLEYKNKHSDKKFIHRLEDTLEALRNNKVLLINRVDKDQESIVPLFLHRNNDYYYLYYHYVGNNKIYHTRFDNIVNMKLTDVDDDINISKNAILDNISQSTNSYYSNKAENINFKIINDSEYLRARLYDDFPNVIFTNDGFSIKASINNALFSKLTSYDDYIKIDDKQIANQYISFLKMIITRNKG